MKYGAAQREGQPVRLFNSLKKIHEHYRMCSELNEKSPFYFDTEEPVFLYKKVSSKRGGPSYQFLRMLMIKDA